MEFIDPGRLAAVRGRVWEFIPASLLLEALPRHPLQVPLDPDGKMTFDFLRLDFYLHTAPARKLLDRLPIDAAPLLELCDAHREQVGLADVWTDDFFYLELLSREGTLTPLFWGQVEHMLTPLGLLERAGELREKGTVSAAGRKASQQAWQTHAQQFFEAGIVTPHSDGPWLARLAHRDFPRARWSDDEGRQWHDEHPGDGMFAAGLYWEREPFYAYHPDMDTLWSNMVRELWVSSIFCPRPISIHDKAKWSRHGRRFALAYRRYTSQQARKADFEAFVLSRWPQGDIAAIARQAREAGLWPYGTPRGQDKPGYDAQEACRQAVYRVLREAGRMPRASRRTT
jgi:hypothetical protein